jgi:pyruvate dehydrogenase E1 component alpha subunit
LLTGGRSIGFALARGLEPGRVMAELLGKVTGPNRGRAGRGHLSWPEQGFFGAHAVVGGNIGVAAGVALARQMAGAPGIAAVVFGDGASGAGILHESLNIAALWRLPVLFLCNNNQLSVSTPRRGAVAASAIADLAAAHGISAMTVDGMDVAEVAAAAGEAAGLVRRGGGPRFIECVSWRFAAHSTAARETRGAAALREIRARCPIEALGRALLGDGDVTTAELAMIDEEVADEVRRALEFADASPYPDAGEALADVD